MFLRKADKAKKYNFEDLYLGMKLKNDRSCIMNEYCINELKKYYIIKENLTKNKKIDLVDKKIEILEEKLRGFNS